MRGDNYVRTVSITVISLSRSFVVTTIVPPSPPSRKRRNIYSTVGLSQLYLYMCFLLRPYYVLYRYNLAVEESEIDAQCYIRACDSSRSDTQV